MALRFSGGDADRVDFGSASVLDGLTAHTCVLWVRPIAAVGGTSTFLVEKGTFGGGNRNPSFGFEFAALNLSVGVDRATTASFAMDDTELNAGIWWCVALTYDEANGCQLFKGRESEPIREVSYFSQQIGTGATSNPSGSNLLVGGNAGAASVNADIALFAHWPRRLLISELRDVQVLSSRNLYVLPRGIVGSIVCSRLGPDATDWSGYGNHGVITGAVYHLDDPLSGPRLSRWRRTRLWDVPQAAVGGTLVKDVIGIGFIPWAR